MFTKLVSSLRRPSRGSCTGKAKRPRPQSVDAVDNYQKGRKDAPTDAHGTRSPTPDDESSASMSTYAESDQPSSKDMSSSNSNTTGPLSSVRSATPRGSLLEERKREEHNFIKNNDSSEADVWYLIDVRWLQEWKQFVTRGTVPPGPLDNSRLVDPRTLRIKSPPRGREKWEPVDDYRGVNEEVWNFWHSRYGGGPVLRRRELDLYAEDLPQGNSQEDARLADPSGGMRQEPPLPGMASPAVGNHPAQRGSGQGWSSRRQAEDWASGQNAGLQGKEASESGSCDRPVGAATAAHVASSGTPSCAHAVAAATSSMRRGVSSMRAPAVQKDAEEENSKICLPCCDKCDGPHETDKCPHFKKAREKHPDAWVGKGTSRKSKAASSPADHDEVPIVRSDQARVVPQPGDGSCLFHALSYGLPDRPSASSLRRDICSYMVKHPDMTIADTAIKDWIKYDSNDSVQAYADRMRGGVWGGGIEMAVLHRMCNVNVHVYERCREGFKRISAFDSKEALQTVSVLYQGRNHYDFLAISA